MSKLQTKSLKVLNLILWTFHYADSSLDIGERFITWFAKTFGTWEVPEHREKVPLKSKERQFLEVVLQFFWNPQRF